MRTIARLNVGGPAVRVVHPTGEFRKRGHESLLVVRFVPETEGNMVHDCYPPKRSLAIRIRICGFRIPGRSPANSRFRSCSPVRMARAARLKVGPRLAPLGR